MDPLLQRISDQADKARYRRDEEGWPEPRTIDDLRSDPRVQLRNRLSGGPENLELAIALMLVVLQDHAALAEAAGA